MNDDPLKREIEEALDVEPSPQFVARVRQHIAEQPATRSVRWSWKIWAPGLAMAGLLVGLLTYRTEPGPAPLPPREVTQVVTPTEQAPARPPARQPKATVKTAVRKAVQDPEVLFDPRETAAMQRFLDNIEQRKIDPSMLQALFTAAEKAQSAVIEPMPVAGLEPIEVPPLIAPVPEKEGGSL